MSGLSMGNLYFSALEFFGIGLYLLMALAVGWVVLAILALRAAAPPDRRKPQFIALLAGLVAALLTALLLPAWTDASFHHIAVLADYVALTGGAIGVGMAVGIGLLPALWLAGSSRS